MKCKKEVNNGSIVLGSLNALFFQINNSYPNGVRTIGSQVETMANTGSFICNQIKLFNEDRRNMNKSKEQI